MDNAYTGLLRLYIIVRVWHSVNDSCLKRKKKKITGPVVLTYYDILLHNVSSERKGRVPLVFNAMIFETCQ